MPELQFRRSLTGGLRLATRKRMSTSSPIDRDLMPERLVIPMTQ